jgi:protein TonB
MRIGVAFLLAALVNLALFALMSAMVSQGRSQLADSTLVQLVDFVRPEPVEEPEPKRLREPPPPPPEPPPAMQPLPKVELPQPNALPPRLRAPKVSLELPLQLDGGPYLGDMLAESGLGVMLARDLTPLITPPPFYPRTARVRRKEGYVEVEFTVDKEGGVRDIRVIAANPPGLFERAAKRAISRWKFEPHRVGGEAMAVRARQRVEFKLRSK